MELARGELIRLLYRLARGGASGVVRVTIPGQRTEVLVLRRGQLITAESDVAGRIASAKLARLVAQPGARAVFEGGTAACPPGALRHLALASWVRHHLESQLDTGRAAQLATELAGSRLVLRPDLAPDPATCDAADQRILAALDQPRRLDQIGALARTSRFRLLCFLHFLRSVGALGVTGVAAYPRAVALDPRADARRLLGVDAYADATDIKRAYRRLARALHPDLRADLDEVRRRELERRLAEVIAAYGALQQG